ncbi:MAG: hypothetical protein WC809_00325 [Sinimarinibacterium sp.]|jgi:hypothetical protein
MTPDVELVYDADCPNVRQARAQLLRAFAAAGRAARWREWRSDDRAAPGRVQGLGSPTILVGGRDVVPIDNAAACCRVYMATNGLAAVPPMDTLVAAIKAGTTPSGWKSAGLWGPGVGIAFLPKLVCPACWPAYAALASAVGMPFLLEARFLFWITLAALTLIVAALAWRAPSRRGYGPMGLALGAGALVLAAKFLIPSNPAAYTGAGLLLVACVWNAWPLRRGASHCPACTPGASS